jgi:hypothetical protein
MVLPLLSILVGESCLLVLWCAGVRCDMVDSDKDCGWSRRIGVEDQGWSSIDRVLGGRTVEISGDAWCSLHRAQGQKECGFLGCVSKPRSTISPNLTSKSVALGFPVWASKPAAMVW